MGIGLSPRSRGGNSADLIPELSANLDARYRNELQSIQTEKDSTFASEALFQFGQRLEADSRLEAAAQVYAKLVTDPSPPRERVPEGRVRASFHDIRRRAEARLDAITGTGSSAHRAEFLLQHFARDTMEPTTLVGLTAASAAFRMTRLASLSRLVGSPTINFATRGFGARAAASLMGFGVEATVFPLASRGTAAALGRDLDWSFNQVGREIAGSFLVLGTMKLTGAAVGRVLTRRADVVLGGSKPVLQQAGMFAGILLGHHLETTVGLRPRVDGATTFVDSLAMLVQFNAAGRLAHGIMGEGFRTWELALDHQARTLAAPPIPAPPPRGVRGLIYEFLLGSRAVLAFPSPLVGEGPRRGGEGAGANQVLFPTHILMENKNDSNPRIRIEGKKESRKVGGVIEGVSDYQKAFYRLLEEPMKRDVFSLHGALADLVRFDPELRRTLQERLAADQDPAFVELNGRKGYLNKILFFQGQSGGLKPERAIFAHKVLRYDDNLDLMVFDLEWLKGNEIRGRLYFPTSADSVRQDSVNSGQVASPKIIGPGRLRWHLFPKTSYEIFVEKKSPDGPWEIQGSQAYPIFSLSPSFPP